METVTITMSREEAAAVLALLSKKVVEPAKEEAETAEEKPAKRRGRKEEKKQDVSEWAAPADAQIVHDEISAPPAPEASDPYWAAMMVEAPAPMTIKEAADAITALTAATGGDAGVMAALMTKFQGLIKKYGTPGGRGLNSVPVEKLADLVAEMRA